MVEYWDSYLGKFVEGGAGSGNFGHSGRPGERGGSGEGGEVGGDSPAVQAAAVRAIENDPSIAYDAPEDFTPFKDNDKLDPLHIHSTKFAENFRDAKIEHALCTRRDGTLILEKTGNANSVKFTGSEVDDMQGAALHIHNHPECDRPFSTADFKFAVATNVQSMQVISKNYVFTMHRPEGGWPKKMARDAAKQIEFKPSGREAWAVWNKFGTAYNSSFNDLGRRAVWDKARRINMVRVCKYFGVKYTQEKL